MKTSSDDTAMRYAPSDAEIIACMHKADNHTEEARQKMHEALHIDRLALGRALAKQSGEQLDLTDEEQKQAEEALVHFVALKLWAEQQASANRKKTREAGLRDLQKDLGL